MINDLINAALIFGAGVAMLFITVCFSKSRPPAKSREREI